VTTLITGADGYLGRRLIRIALASSDEPVVAWMRACDKTEFEEKTSSMRAAFAHAGDRVRYTWGDLTSPDPLAQVAPHDIKRIIHTAAITAFNVERELATQVNVVGSTRVFDFARRCERLERLVYLSTVYASGLRSGSIPEDVFDDSAGFANHYEWSKWRGERELAERYADLPWQVHRIATILCDNAEGEVVQFNVFHKVWRLLYWGMLPLVPGRETTPLYLVTGDFASEAIWSLAAGREQHSFYHVTHDRAGALTLLDCVDGAYEAFCADPAFRARRILKPLFADEKSFDWMANNATMFSQDALGHVVQLVRPFAKQMFIEKSFRIDRLSQAVPVRNPSDPRPLVERTCAHLIRTGWGTGAKHSDGGG
jgi:thioester reductase-like protein